MTTTSNGTIVTSGAAHTKGAYAVLVSPSVRPSIGINLMFRGNSADRFSVDLAIGAGGAEQIIANDLVFSSDGSDAYTYWLPLSIPAGTPVSVKCQSLTGSSTCRVTGLLMAAPSLGALVPSDSVYGRCTTYGFDAANSRGTLITAHATIHTKGNYAAIGTNAVTTNPMRAMYVAFTPGTVGAALFLTDIAIGIAGSEVIVAANLGAKHVSTTREPTNTYGPIPVDIPAGARLSADCQANVTVCDIGVVIYGLD